MLQDTVDRVRGALQAVPVDRRYYDMIVNSLNEERIDEAGEPTIDNMVFPPSTASLPGADNRFVPNTAHVALGFHPQVMAQSLALLRAC